MPALDALTVLLAQSSEARVHFRTSGKRERGGGYEIVFVQVWQNMGAHIYE